MPLRRLGSGLALSSSAATRAAALLYSVELPPPATYSNAPTQSCLCVMVVPFLPAQAKAQEWCTITPRSPCSFSLTAGIHVDEGGVRWVDCPSCLLSVAGQGQVPPGSHADAEHTWAYAVRTGASAAAKSASLAPAAATLQDASTPSTSRPPCTMQPRVVSRAGHLALHNILRVLG